MDQPKSVELAGFAVMGLAARTSNALEMAGESRIGPLWQAFQSGAGDLIPGALEKDCIYSVYTNYESDHTGAYDVILGRKVADPSNAPAGMQGVRIPPGRYLIFAAAGPAPEAIQAAWMGVYEYFSRPDSTQRAFLSDFELYSAAGVQLQIGVS